MENARKFRTTGTSNRLAAIWRPHLKWENKNILARPQKAFVNKILVVFFLHARDAMMRKWAMAWVVRRGSSNHIDCTCLSTKKRQISCESLGWDLRRCQIAKTSLNSLKTMVCCFFSARNQQRINNQFRLMKSNSCQLHHREGNVSVGLIDKVCARSLSWQYLHWASNAY